MKINQRAIVFFLCFVLVSCKPITPTTFEKPQFFVVTIEGALENPGDFQVKPYATLDEVLELITLSDDSDLSSFNMKMIVKHHDKITIPYKQEIPCININVGSVDQLMTLHQVGEVIALRIIEHRNTHGFFQHIEDLMHVKGIGEKTFEKNKANLCL